MKAVYSEYERDQNKYYRQYSCCWKNCFVSDEDIEETNCPKCSCPIMFKPDDRSLVCLRCDFVVNTEP
ncbi:MAG: hypothetical protein ACFFC7_30135 [Candidatus Hermodarchaeota archaeon]